MPGTGTRGFSTSLRDNSHTSFIETPVSATQPRHNWFPRCWVSFCCP